MTDNEIIKTFEDKISLLGSMTSVYLDEKDGFDLYEVMMSIRALINHKNAEIEGLQSLCTAKDVIIKEQEADIERLNGNLFTISNACMQRRNEAIKEFAERLKIDWQENDFYWEEADVYKWIDNLVKEMAGGEDA